MWLFDCDCDCLEHVKKSISDKLKELQFPNAQEKKYYGWQFSNTLQLRNKWLRWISLCTQEKWLDIESKHTKSEGQGKFVQYFEKSKQLSFKNKTYKKCKK